MYFFQISAPRAMWIKVEIPAPNQNAVCGHYHNNSMTMLSLNSSRLLFVSSGRSQCQCPFVSCQIYSIIFEGGKKTNISHHSHTWVEGAVTWMFSNAMTVKTHVLPVPDLACTIRSESWSKHSIIMQPHWMVIFHKILCQTRNETNHHEKKKNL